MTKRVWLGQEIRAWINQISGLGPGAGSGPSRGRRVEGRLPCERSVSPLGLDRGDQFVVVEVLCAGEDDQIDKVTYPAGSLVPLSRYIA